jgi:hypothetical protein
LSLQDKITKKKKILINKTSTDELAVVKDPPSPHFTWKIDAATMYES